MLCAYAVNCAAHAATPNSSQANFLEHLEYTIVYRRYASLFFICGIDKEAVSKQDRGRGICASRRLRCTTSTAR